MLFTPGNDFQWTVSNATAGNAAPGTSLTPANNSFSSYATCIAAASVTNDIYGLFVNINSGANGAAARDTLINIGIDEAGGTSFTTKIPNLLGSCSNPVVGHQYYFPLFIKAGSTIGAQASINNGTVGTVSVHLIGYGLPSRPELVRTGSFVRSFGETTASSKGTAITPGSSAAEGSYTQLGSATAEDLWWWQWGFGTSDATMQALGYACDIAAGDASNKENIIENEFVGATTNEQLVKMLSGSGYYHEIPSGTNIYGRSSCSGTPDSNISMMAYGLGG